MAAHDTLTSSLTSFVAALAADPKWQDKLRDEVNALGVAPDAPTAIRQSRSHAAHRDGVQGGDADQAAGALDPAAGDARFQFWRLSDPGGHAGRGQSAVHPSHAGHMARSRHSSIRCGSPTRRSAAAIASPGCRSAAARICVLGCISPTCRRNASRGISCRISASRCSPAPRRIGRCGRSRSRETDCA